MNRIQTLRSSGGLLRPDGAAAGSSKDHIVADRETCAGTGAVDGLQIDATRRELFGPGYPAVGRVQDGSIPADAVAGPFGRTVDGDQGIRGDGGLLAFPDGAARVRRDCSTGPYCETLLSWTTDAVQRGRCW